VPKNSRPDIQVLEARVARLKTQLFEYKDIRTYDITKQRLIKVSKELEECINIIDEVVNGGEGCKHRLVALKEPEIEATDEFNDDGDLADVFFAEPETSQVSELAKYSPKEIIHNYADRLKECSEATTGVVQINMFCSLLNSWFQKRFIPEIKNPNFYYKADRIHEWIDLLILAAGSSINCGTFAEFKSYMDEWTESLNTSKDDGWLLPLKVRQIEQDPCAYTYDAVLIETIVKKILYNDAFYIGERRSVARIVKDHVGCKDEDLTIQQLIKACPRMIMTSAFDITKYQ